GTTLAHFNYPIYWASRALFDLYAPLFQDRELLKQFVTGLAEDIRAGRVTRKDVSSQRQLEDLFAGRMQANGVTPTSAVNRPDSPLIKVMVLDGDYTLWGDAVSEVGAENVRITGEFLAVQQRVLQLQRTGV